MQPTRNQPRTQDTNIARASHRATSVPTRSRTPQSRSSHWGRLLGCSVALCLAPACTWTAPADENFVGTRLAESRVGKNGGELSVIGATISVPKGALKRTSDLQIEQMSSLEAAGLPATPASVQLVTPPTRFTPHGLSFEKPVTIDLKIPQSKQSDVRRVVLKLEDEQDKTWALVPEAKVGPKEVVFQTSSFSIYGIFDDPYGLTDHLSEIDGGDGTGGTSGEDGTGGAGAGQGASSGGSEPGTGGNDGKGGEDTSSGGSENQPGSGGSGGEDTSTGGSATNTGGSGSGGVPTGTGGVPGSGGLGGELAPYVIYQGAGIRLETNILGFEGGFTVEEDSAAQGASDFDPAVLDDQVEPSTFDVEEPQACVDGVLPAAMDPQGQACEGQADLCDWETYWGGGIGMSLASGASVDLLELGMEGIQFEFSGGLSGVSALRLTAINSDFVEYCYDFPADVKPGSYYVPLSTLVYNCWEPGGEPVYPVDIQSFRWTLVPSANGRATVESFCLEEVALVGDPLAIYIPE